MQSKKEKLQERIRENQKPRNLVMERLKHISWWGWSTDLIITPSIKKI